MDIVGLLQPLLVGRSFTTLGYRSRGGTFDTQGMLFANGCSWAHAVRAAAEPLHIDILDLLSEAELVALEKIGDPDEIVLKTLESV